MSKKKQPKKKASKQPKGSVRKNSSKPQTPRGIRPDDKPYLAPLVKEKVWAYLKQAGRRPVGIREFARVLELDQKDQRQLRRYLKYKAKHSNVQQFRGGRFMLNQQSGSSSSSKAPFRDTDESKIVQGVLQIYTNGDGGIQLEDGGRLYIPSRHFNGALHGDEVVAKQYKDRQGRTTGKITMIETPFSGRLIGTVRKVDGMPHFIPENERYPWMPIGKRNDAEFEDWVVARLYRPPHDPSVAIAKIESVLKESEGIEWEIIRGAAILEVESFPPDVLIQAEKVAQPPSEAEAQTRLDLRDVPLVTIDGEDARDFDDAVAFIDLPDGRQQLIVAIADVAHYVTRNDELDKEAMRRGTSIYFPTHCIPMLPESLSNGICSLRPNEERLCMAVLMEMKDGRVVDASIEEAIMCSHARLTYNQVADVLHEAGLADAPDGWESEGENPAEAFKERLIAMATLSKQIHERRRARGSIDFDIPEPHVVLDEEQSIVGIVKRQRNLAHKMIEDFMLLANEVVAKYLLRRDLPGIYRIHEEPDAGKVEEFMQTLQALGVSLAPRSSKSSGQDHWDLDPLYLGELIIASREHRASRMLNQLLLRSMKQASYASENVGHYGLALHEYLHFTSPIRRYPDLWVHRLVKMHLHKKMPRDSDQREELELFLEEVAEQSSRRERQAMEAEREVLSRMKAQFMQDHIGEVCKGVISSITPFGFFVELDDYFVDGLIHIRQLKGSYDYDETQLRLVAPRSGHVFSIGDAVQVEVLGSSPEKGEVDFGLLEHMPFDTPGLEEA
ncbi:MAG TPA: ribonuclease R [Myxococcales bacterium]|nr:ribonuclease R [Deltaproteobacteria bacterium]MBU48505.1 ribonuclease R [Deltaproteobacteria bacterium]HAA54411.1 ribonuclease R [Myxococcales bacterium]|tara:strand:- start:15681 stop:18035 length:2355 start_codon:yes stop_codon:yes gene_type:complete